MKISHVSYILAVDVFKWRVDDDSGLLYQLKMMELLLI